MTPLGEQDLRYSYGRFVGIHRFKVAPLEGLDLDGILGVDLLKQLGKEGLRDIGQQLGIYRTARTGEITDVDRKGTDRVESEARVSYMATADWVKIMTERVREWERRHPPPAWLGEQRRTKEMATEVTPETPPSPVRGDDPEKRRRNRKKKKKKRKSPHTMDSMEETLRITPPTDRMEPADQIHPVGVYNQEGNQAPETQEQWLSRVEAQVAAMDEAYPWVRVGTEEIEGGRTPAANNPEKRPYRRPAHLGMENEPRPAIIPHNQTLPPWSEVVLSFSAGELLEGEVLLEPRKLKTHGLRVARGLTTLRNGKGWMKIANLTGGGVVLEAGTPVGDLETILEGEARKAKIRTVREDQVVEGRHYGTIASKAEHLAPSERAALIELLRKYETLFDEPGVEGCKLPVEHRIETGDAKPIAKRPYPVPERQRPIIAEQIQEMLTKGVIRPSDSPWSAPVVIVPKKSPDGERKYRFCTDFRALNEVTRKDAYPLPNINDTLEHLGRSAWFTTIDLASGYHQIPVAEKDREKTGFTTGGGHYEYNKMPFGLAGAPATFQRLMDRLLAEMKGTECFVYLDDVIIFSATFDEHLRRLDGVFKRLSDANLKVGLAKCCFAQSEVNYLGHVVTSEGVKPDPSKLTAIREYPTPRNVKEVRGFLGLAGYYRRFIAEFANIAKPLTQLLKKETPFQWEGEQEQATQHLKEALCSSDVLIYPDYRDDFIVSTDASGTALGAILSQKRDGQERPISYASRQLNSAERNYSTTERELLAVMYAIKQFRCYLYGRKFTLITDHAALKWMLNLKDPSARLTRWALRLAEYDYEVVHKPGKSHTNVDALSRTVAVVQEVNAPGELDATQIQELAADQDKEWGKKLTKPGYKQDARKLWYRQEKGQGPWRLVIPAAWKKRILTSCHAPPWAGHLGRDKLTKKMANQYYWPGMTKDIRQFVKTCPSCSLRRAGGPKAPLQPVAIPERPFERVSLDIVGPLPRTGSGYKYLLTFIDHLTRYAEAIPLRDQTAPTVARAFIQHVVLRHGVPESLLTDQGTNFMSTLMKAVCRQLGIRKLRTTPYHPESNGVIERFHGTLTGMIKHFVRANGTDWDQWVPFALLAYRSQEHSATGYSPHYLLCGQEVNLPGEAWVRPKDGEGDEEELTTHVMERLEEARRVAHQQIHQQWKKRAQRCNRRRRPRRYEAGDKVYVHNPVKPAGTCAKFHCPWTGPHTIKERMSDVTYRVKLAGGGEAVLHTNRLKPAYPEDEDQSEESTTEEGPRVPDEEAALSSDEEPQPEERRSSPSEETDEWQETRRLLKDVRKVIPPALPHARLPQPTRPAPGRVEAPRVDEPAPASASSESSSVDSILPPWMRFPVPEARNTSPLGSRTTDTTGSSGEETQDGETTDAGAPDEECLDDESLLELTPEDDGLEADRGEEAGENIATPETPEVPYWDADPRSLGPQPLSPESGTGAGGTDPMQPSGSEPSQGRPQRHRIVPRRLLDYRLEFSSDSE